MVRLLLQAESFLQLHSPEELKGMILVKGKRLISSADDDDDKNALGVDDLGEVPPAAEARARKAPPDAPGLQPCCLRSHPHRSPFTAAAGNRRELEPDRQARRSGRLQYTRRRSLNRRWPARAAFMDGGESGILDRLV